MSDGFEQGWQQGYNDSIKNHEIIVHVFEDNGEKYFSHISVSCKNDQMIDVIKNNQHIHGYDAGYAEGFISAGGKISDNFDKEKYCKENNILIKNS